MNERTSIEKQAARLEFERCKKCGRVVLDPERCPFDHCPIPPTDGSAQ